MPTYRAPLQELRFVLHEVLDVERELSALPIHAGLDAGTIDQVIEEAGKFAAEAVFPLNRDADRVGCRFEAGRVSTPPGFADVYRQYCELGWPALACDTEWGGQGLPRVVGAAVHEMLASASQAFHMFGTINQCAHDCLSRAASGELRQRWLPRLVDGSVLATMCMSEPQAGSDLGLLTTRALPQPDGTFCISGTKIFASGGEHELTGNILHLVLARLAGAPAGTRGLSLFVVPKLLEDGSRNAAHCVGIEHKLGLHGSPTCVMNFDAATGWLVGEPNRGLAAMFHMMNAARLSTGLQAIGVSEAACQAALAYARERRQGRAPAAGGTRQAEAADLLVGHPDVQRMLLTQKAYIEGGRAFAFWSAQLIDRSLSHPRADERARAADMAGLLTPVIKGFLSENAVICTNLALQIHGGHGYVTETGVDQYLRDVRITTIYEGTTGIQAIDLLVRKVLADDGSRLNALLTLLRGIAGLPVEGAGGSALATRFDAVLQQLASSTASIRDRSASDTSLPFRVATDYLRLFGHAVLAAWWMRMASMAAQAPAQGDAHAGSPDRFLAGKAATARFYFEHVLPETASIAARIEGDAGGYEAALN